MEVQVNDVFYVLWGFWLRPIVVTTVYSDGTFDGREITEAEA
jgi:hypothetical protein